MPNQGDEPRGAWPAGRVYTINSYLKGTNLAIYAGDFVMVGADGKTVVATAGNTHLRGVAVGYKTATDTDVLVYDHPDQEYWIQDDGVGGTLANTNIGNNLDILATAGNATTLKSQMEADTSSVTLATANLRILGLHPDSSFSNANAIIRVAINEHHFAKKNAGL